VYFDFHGVEPRDKTPYGTPRDLENLSKIYKMRHLREHPGYVQYIPGTPGLDQGEWPTKSCKNMYSVEKKYVVAKMQSSRGIISVDEQIGIGLKDSV
jgi:hypothetical protein